MGVRLSNDSKNHSERSDLELDFKATTYRTALSLHLQRFPGTTHTSYVATGNHQQTAQTTLLPLSSFCRTQGLRRRTGRYRPLSTQFTHTLSKFQDAHSTKSQKLHSKTSTLHVHRPVGCFPSRANSPPFSEVSRILSQRYALLLPSHALRHQPGPQNLLSDHHRSTKTGTYKGDTGLRLHRRLALMEPVTLNPLCKHAESHLHPTKPRFHYQPQKISARSSGCHHVPGHTLARPFAHSSPQRRKSKQSLAARTLHTLSPLATEEELPTTTRVPKFHSPLHSRGPLPPSSAHSERPKVHEHPNSFSLANLPPTPTLVAGPSEHISPFLHINPPTTMDNMDRRLVNRLGWSRFSRTNGERTLVRKGENATHQRLGMLSHREMPTEPPPTNRYHNHDKIGQHDGGFHHKQTRFQQEQGPQQHPVPDTSVVRTQQLDTQIETPPRPLEHLGGLPIQGSPSQVGMEPDSGDIQQPEQTPQSRDRSVRPSRQLETAKVRLPISLSKGNSCRRPLSRLERVEEDLPLPSSRPHPKLPPQTQRIRGKRPFHCTPRAFSPMVARIRRPVSAHIDRTRRRSACVRQADQSTRSDILDLSRLQFLRNLYSRKFPLSVSQALAAAHRHSTNNQYENCWKDFQKWLSNKEGTKVNKASILLYLTELATTRHLSPKTILVYRNALKLPLLYGFNIKTTDREFSLLARGQFIQNPPPKRFIPAWNPNKVLSMLGKSQFLNHRATPHDLLKKTLFLIALACGNRVSELAAFTRIATSILPGAKKAMLAVRPGFLYKNQTIDHTPPNIIIESLLDSDGSPHRLCPVDALQHWLNVTKDWASDAIFINPKSKKAMNRGAISLLLVNTINTANPGIFAKAHDIRKVSASLAWARGVPPREIVQTMFWKRSTVFLNKYLISIKNI